jgi:hypothetical protein
MIDIDSIVRNVESIDTSLKVLLEDIDKQLKHTNPSGADHYRLLEIKKGIWAILQNKALLAISINEK